MGVLQTLVFLHRNVFKFLLVWNPCAAPSGTLGTPPEPSGTPWGTMIGAADSWLPEDPSGRPASQK